MVGSTDCEAIVIGAGLGGLSAAALLANAGRKVVVLEKNRFIGGRFSASVRDGFTVDRGTHMITRIADGPYGAIVERLGIAGRIEFIRLERRNPPLIEFRGKRTAYPFIQWTLPTSLALIPLRWRFSLPETLGAAVAMGRIVTDPGCTAKRLDGIDFESWLSRFMPAGNARDLLGSLPAPLFGIPPWEFSAGMAITAVQDWFMDACSGYPRGGTGRIAEVMREVIETAGGVVSTGQPVSSVTTRAGRVTGVKLADGTRFRSPVVISNLGIKDTLSALVGSRRLPNDYFDRVMSLKDPSMSTVQVKLALKKKLIDAPCVMGSADERIDLSAFYRDIAAGTVPGSFMGIVNAPSNIDADLAPEGEQLLLGMMLCPCEAEDWRPWLDLCERGVEELVPGARAAARWIERLTPEDVADASGRTTNASLGLAQVPGQVRSGRPGVSTPLEGLFCVGDDTGREGTCSELAIDSAMMCFDRIERMGR